MRPLHQCAGLFLFWGAATLGLCAKPVAGFWDLIPLMREVKFEKADIEKLFGAPLDQVQNNGFWTFYEGRGPVLGDGVDLVKVGFSRKNDDGAAPILYMDMTGTCIPFEELKKRFPDIKLHAGPGHPSPNPRFGYRVERADEGLAFSVGPKATGCVHNLGYWRNRKAD
jgi:hypothetical protein